MQDLHARMLGALLAGEGLRGVADLAAGEAGLAVAIVLPARGLAVCTADGAELEELISFAARRARDEAATAPESVEAVAPVIAAGEAGSARPTRIYAILPARGADDAPERTATAARALAGRLRAHGPAAFSSFYASPSDLGRAVAEAELMLEVIAVDDRIAGQLAEG